MIKSMTGFGKGEAKGRSGTVKAEIRAINHKFLEIGIKLPEGIASLEDKIRELAQGYVCRGKVNINIAYEDGLGAADKISVDEKLAKAYYRQLNGLKKKIKLEGSIRLDQLIALPGVITYEPKKAAAHDAWPAAQAALRKAFRSLDSSRLKEGRALQADLKKRIKNIEGAIKVIGGREKINTDLYRERLKKSIKELSKGVVKDFDKGRLEQEVAMYAKNSDITEEITRLSAHMKNLRETVEKDAEAGKKLDFIAQELNREANTVGSKVSDFKISKKVIQIKSEIEKLREQAKNIE
ncbi:MAG: YicC family protein [Candidatus Omnitrophica bacterium]|nr:YicC family protein [Candidatus Omnitrophota bacterium]